MPAADPRRQAHVVAFPRDAFKDSGEARTMRNSGLEAVFMESRATLLRFLRARGAGTDAEDILQELWLKLSAMHAQGPIADPLAYLHRMADNLMHDRHRAARRRERREMTWHDMAATSQPDISDDPSPERVLVARDTLRRVEAALEQLSERSRAIFRRFRVDGIGQKIIAREEGISVSAVEKHLQRAYRALMECEERLGLRPVDHADARENRRGAE